MILVKKLFILVLLFTLVACGQQVTSSPSDDTVDYEIKVTDGTGYEIELDQPAKRIVEVRGSSLDMLADLGVEDVVTRIGYQDLANLFFGEDEAKGFGQIRGTWNEPNIEDIIATKPDLIIGGVYPHQYLRDALNGGAPVYLLTEKGHYLNAVEDLKKLGILTGREVEAEKAINRFLEKLEGYKSKSPKDIKALVLMGSDANFKVYTEKSRTGSLLGEVTDYPSLLSVDAKEQYEIALSLEELFAIDPEVLFMESLGEEKLSEQLSEHPVWSQLSAVKNGRVYEITGNVWHSGRGPGGSSFILDEAMPLLYPDIFPKK